MKTETHYNFILSATKDYQETIGIIREESIKRNAIKLELYSERWRTPKETIKLLEDTMKIIKDNFINK